MTEQPSMVKTVKYVVLSAIVFVCVSTIGLYAAFPNTSNLLLALLTQKLPDTSHIQRIRKDLHAQERFIDMLVEHEKAALYRFNHKRIKFYEKKHIYKTPTSMFDIHALHDYWEVWVRTDIIEGKPFTSYLIRLGLIKDTNAATFFSNQCQSKLIASTMRRGLALYNDMFDREIFKPIRLNITESDQTSTISRTRTKRSKWSETVKKRHQQETGISFFLGTKSF